MDSGIESGKLQPGETIHAFSAGEWSIHDQLILALEQFGPMHLRVSTWSLSVKVATNLVATMHAGHLLSFRALLNWAVRVHTPDSYEMIRANLGRRDYRGAETHAKVYTLWNDHNDVTIVASANLTQNPRTEACVISTDPEVREWHTAWIERWIATGGTTV